MANIFPIDDRRSGFSREPYCCHFDLSEKSPTVQEISTFGRDDCAFKRSRLKPLLQKNNHSASPRLCGEKHF